MEGRVSRASRSRTQRLGLKSRNTQKAQATSSQNLPFFAPSLPALRIRGGQSHRDQTPDGVGRTEERRADGPPDRGPNVSDSNHVIRKKRRRPAVRTYPSLRPACLRSAYAADNPIAIKHRMASERDGRPGLTGLPIEDPTSRTQIT